MRLPKNAAFMKQAVKGEIVRKPGLAEIHRIHGVWTGMVLGGAGFLLSFSINSRALLLL